jgi:histidinol-phosphate aminotransferase
MRRGRTDYRSGIEARVSRKIVRDLKPYVPGTTIDEVQRKYDLERIVKLASNENPLGSSPKAMAALQNVDLLHLYLDDTHGELRERLAAPYGLSADNVVLGHGSNDLVGVLAEAMLESGDEAVMADPSFSLYPLVTTLRGAKPVLVPVRDFTHDPHAMLSAVTARTRVMFVCDPNNPTGTAMSRDAWGALLAGLPDDVLLVVDQAYGEYMDERGVDAVPASIARPNTLVLRTMSKIYGLASLRFGYGFGDAQTIELLNRVRLPFNVSRPAAVGAMGALDDDDFVRRSIAANEAGKTYLHAEFARLGLQMVPTQANFYALAVPVTATRAYQDLLERGVIVRSGDALRMPGYLRITVGTAEENGFLVETIERLLPAWRSL